MKKKFVIPLAIICFLLSTCKKDDPEPAPVAPTPTPTVCTPAIVSVTTDVNTPTVWDACHIYVIGVNQISVTSTLTIEPGTIIKFKDNVGDNAILVSNSGRVNAIGTASKPICFTSYKDDTHGGDNNSDGTTTSPAQFDWGGIIINNNNCTFKYCTFIYGGEGPSPGSGQPSLEFSLYYGTVDHCTFINCGGETSYNGYGVVDARGCENPSFVITNSTFYGCVKPLFLNPHNSVDNSNVFHNPANVSEKNQLNGIFMANTSNEATTDVTWQETEVPFVFTGSYDVGDGLKLIVDAGVIIKMATLPSIGSNRIGIREGSSSIQGYNLPGVYLTSYLDDSLGGDTNGDGTLSTPGSADWYGVLDLSASIATNNFCYGWTNILHADFP